MARMHVSIYCIDGFVPPVVSSTFKNGLSFWIPKLFILKSFMSKPDAYALLAALADIRSTKAVTSVAIF